MCANSTVSSQLLFKDITCIHKQSAVSDQLNKESKSKWNSRPIFASNISTLQTVYYSSYRWFCFMAKDKSVRLNLHNRYTF